MSTAQIKSRISWIQSRIKNKTAKTSINATAKAKRITFANGGPVKIMERHFSYYASIGRYSKTAFTLKNVAESTNTFAINFARICEII